MVRPLNLSLLLLWFVLSMRVQQSHAQLADYNVQLLDEGDQIRTSNILKMVKDIHGFLWMLSPRYIQRFDGQNLKRFDIDGEDLLDIVADHDGKIWVSTQSTIRRFVSDSRGFQRLRIDGPLPTKFNVMQVSTQNQVWIISGKGLFVYDKRADAFLHQPVPGLADTQFYRKIFQKSGDEFFIGNTHILFAYNTNTKKVRSIPFNAVSAIAPFSGDILWVTDARLQTFELDFRTGSCSPIQADKFQPRPESNFMEISAVAPLGSDNYLVSTSKGCFRYNRKSGLFNKAVLYHYGSELANNEIYTSYFDQDKTLWMLGQQGIIFFKPLQHTISWLRSFNRKGMDWNNNIRALTGDNQGNIWMATSAGLSRLSLKDGAVKSFHASNSRSAAFQFPSIQGIVYDGKNLILGPGAGGVVLFDPGSETFGKPVYPPGQPALSTKASQDYIYSIVTLSNGNVLVLGDLSCYLLERNTYKISELAFTGSNFILQTAAQDHAGKVWVGTYKGLLLLDQKFKTLAMDTTMTPSKLVTSLLVRNDSTAWAGSVGLFEVTRRGDRLIRRAILPELANQQITMLFQDKTGQIWIGADDGFYRYDAGSKKLEWFDIWDNVQNKQLNPNSLFQAGDGNLYLGGNNGLNYFRPELIGAQRKDLTVLVTSVKINQNDSLYQGRPLELSWNQNTVEIQFVTTYFQNASKVKYRYRLAGLDDSWIYHGNNNIVRFSSLAPGHYRFDLQASLDGISWHASRRAVVFSILSPIWKRPWFFFLAAVMILAIIHLLFKIRVAAVRKQQAAVFALQSKANELEKEKAMAMYESLKQQLNPHFLFNSLTSLDSLIWLDAAKASTFLDGLSRIYRYILKNREKELVPLKEEISFAQNYIALQSTRFGSGLIVDTAVPETMGNFRIAPVTIQNLVENAIKHNIISDDAPLVIRIYTEGQHLVVSNNVQKKNFVETSNKQGLIHLVNLYSFLSPVAVQIIETPDDFVIKLPLV